jgi:hypothetical protein
MKRYEKVTGRNLSVLTIFALLCICVHKYADVLVQSSNDPVNETIDSSINNGPLTWGLKW